MSANMKIKKRKDNTKEEKNINDAVFKDAVDDLDRFEDFFKTNLQKIVTGAIITVIILIVGYLVFMQIQNSKKDAAIALNAAKSIEELNKAIKQYPNSSADKTAQLNLATIYFKDGKFDDALKVYNKIARSASPGEIKSRATLNVAYTLEALKKPNDAAEKFATVGVNDSFPAYVRNEANYSAARILISLGKNKLAENSLKSIKSNTPGDFWTAQALRLSQRLSSKDPLPSTSTKTTTVDSLKKIIPKPATLPKIN